jgi:hypothetical protein
MGSSMMAAKAVMPSRVATPFVVIDALLAVGVGEPGWCCRFQSCRIWSRPERFRLMGTGMLLANLVAVGAALVADAIWYGLGRWRGRGAMTSALAWAFAWTGAGYALGNIANQALTSFGSWR